MESALLYDRLQFAVTSTFHYLFPQLTMGLALLLVYLRTRDLLSADDHFHHVARFWTGIFALSFASGVVTGIPLEFQFGTNWTKFSNYDGESSGKPWRWKGCSRSSWSLLSWACCCSVRIDSVAACSGLPR